MRADPPVSVRQQRLTALAPRPKSHRQGTVIEMSERMVKGFKNNAQRIASRQGISYDRAAAILAAGARRASASAKRKNPRLKKVKGKASNK